ncbi:MAG TPA: exodeoxyribonuclease III [Thermomicrobiales bacterium]|nr:exodeoxyribonuclease III [Thermomicrobiales bacterium]
MKIYSWNVNGIRAVIRKGVFREFVATHQPDILCLQETKARPDQVKPDLPDYREYWNVSDKGGYSGTAIFTRAEAGTVIKGLPDALADAFDLSDDPFGDPNREGRVLVAEFDRFWVVSVYAPNSKGDLSRLDLRYRRWDPAFLTYLSQLESGQLGSGTPKPVVFCGDLNVAHQEIDLAHPERNRGGHGFTDEERERFQDFLDHGFVDAFRHLHPDRTEAYTWWNYFSRSRARNVGWRIDYVLVSEVLKPHLVVAEIHPDVMGSDHCPVSITLDG